MTDEPQVPESGITTDTLLAYFGLGLLAAIVLRSNSKGDPLEELAQRVATIEGKLTR
jgi:hypothetical protein